VRSYGPLRESLGRSPPRQHIPSSCELAESKARQAAKIKEIHAVLIAAGYATLDQQASVLGLPRSTTWTILKAQHKNSGLSATTINRMLSAPRLPSAARVKILQYVSEKSAGFYGDTKSTLRRFTDRLSAKRVHLARN
jgi:hypothetical protein